MKKSIQNIWLRIMLVSVFAVFSSATWGQSYGLQINNVDVTDKNCNDLSVIEGVTGMVKYTPATKTLTLENATITTETSSGSKACINNHNCDGLKIELKGSNKIMPKQRYAIDVYKSTTICGDGKLATDGGWGGLQLMDAPAVIENCQIDINGSIGIEGSGATAKEILTIRNSNINVFAYTYCVYNLGNLVLDECAISEPAGAAFDDEQHSIVYDGVMLRYSLIISGPCYGVKLNGMDITKENSNSLNSIEGVSGNVKYDAVKRILTLENATVSGQGIYNESCPDLQVEVIGTNSIKSTGVCLNVDKSTVICGSGKLNLTSENDAAIKFNNVPFAIEKGCNVVASGKFGISGLSGNSSEILKVNEATVEATGTTAAICNISDLTLNNSYILSPEGAAYDASLKGVAADGKVVTGKVAIAPLTKYGIEVAGVEVTNVNCADLSVIDGVSGTISFDPTTNIMTLQDVTLVKTGDEDGCGIINNSCNGFKLKLIGENNIKTYFSGLSFDKPSVIMGFGSISINSIWGGGIYVNGTLTINDCVVATEGRYGIAGKQSNSNNKIIMRNAAVVMNGSDATMSWIDDFTLEGCSIKEPEGVAFDSALRGLAVDGALVKSKVIVEPKTYGIVVAGVSVKGSNCADLTVIKGVEGNVAYDPTTNTLTLENATITTDDFGICNETNNDLKIMLKGKNSIFAYTGVAIAAKTTIMGDGELNIKGEGIMTNNASIIIDGCTIFIDGKKGIYGLLSLSGAADVGNEVLTVRNAMVDIKSTEGAIPGIGGIILEESCIGQPSGAVYNTVMRAVVYDGKLVIDRLIIQPSSVGIKGVGIDEAVRRQDIYSVQGVKMNGKWESLPAGMYVVDGVKKVKE